VRVGCTSAWRVPICCAYTTERTERRETSLEAIVAAWWMLSWGICRDEERLKQRIWVFIYSFYLRKFASSCPIWYLFRTTQLEALQRGLGRSAKLSAWQARRLCSYMWWTLVHYRWVWWYELCEVNCLKKLVVPRLSWNNDLMWRKDMKAVKRRYPSAIDGPKFKKSKKIE